MPGPLSEIFRRVFRAGAPSPEDVASGAKRVTPDPGDATKRAVPGPQEPAQRVPKETGGDIPGGRLQSLGGSEPLQRRLQETDLNELATETFEQEADPALRARYGIDPSSAPPEPQGLLFNPARIEAPDDIKGLFDEVAEAFPEDFEQYTRGVQSLDDIEARALGQMMGLTTGDVRSLRALEAEDFTKASFTMMNMATEIKKLAEKVRSPEGSAVDAARLRILMEDFAVTTMHVKGLQTETARTLSAMRISKRATAEASAQVAEVLESYGGMGTTKRIAEMIHQLDDPGAIGSFVRRTHKANLVDVLWEAYYASLLSSPQTHLVNATTSFAVYNWRIPEQLVAYGFGKIRKGVLGGEDGVRLREIGAFVADIETLKAASAQAWRSLRSGQPSDLTQKLEGRVRQPALTADFVRESAAGKWLNRYVPDLMKDGHWTQRGFDLMADYTVRGPSRVMIATDEFNKGMAYTSFMRQAATRQATDEGLAGEAFGARVKELLSNPELLLPEANEAAGRFAQEMTFQQPLGRMGSLIQRALVAEPDFESPAANFAATAMQAPIRMTFPFVKTPINIFKYAAQRTPLAPVMPTFWEAIHKGGAEADLAVAKMALGTAVAYGAFEMAAGGYLAGSGPLDPRMSKQWRSLGHQPYSFVVPRDSAFGQAVGLDKDQSISIKRFDPFSMILGLAADMHEVWSFATPDERDMLATTLFASVWRNLGSRTFLESFGEMQDAIGRLEKGDTMGLQTFFTKMAASPLVPAGVAWLGRTTDPEERVARSVRSPTAETAMRTARPDPIDDLFMQAISFGEEMVNRIKKRAPGMGQDLPPLLNFFGEELRGPTGFMWNVVPFYHQDLKFDGAVLEDLGLSRTAWTGTHFSALPYPAQWGRFLRAVGPEGEFIRLGWGPGRHSSTIMGGPMSPDEYHDYVKNVNSVIADPDRGSIVIGEATLSPEAVDLEGLNLKQALNLVMTTEAYYNAPDDLRTSGSKRSIIQRVVNYFRHDANFNPDIGLGGADLMTFLQHPQLQTRVIQSRLRALGPVRQESLEGLLK